MLVGGSRRGGVHQLMDGDIECNRSARALHIIRRGQVAGAIPWMWLLSSSSQKRWCFVVHADVGVRQE